MVILAADLGGTQSRLLLAHCDGDGWQTLRQRTQPSQQYTGISELLEDFLLPGEHPGSACIAAAGPLENNRLHLTNLPWQLDAQVIRRQFGINHLQLLNDFAAQTYALPRLQPHQLCTLQAGSVQPGATRALLGAGTGLGMALLAEADGQVHCLPSQGGHADFAPRDEQQIELLRYLLPVYGRVSQELLLSGAGISRLHAFLGGRPLPIDEQPDAHAINLAADAGEPLAMATLQLFARLYLAAAGNLALTGLALGGVYLSGGIAPKILRYLQAPDAIAEFQRAGPMTALLRSIPLQVVLDEHLGLHGATWLAARMERAAGVPS
jgi:glucokinase